MPDPSPCPVCGHPVLRVRTATGLTAVLDARPVPGGPVVLRDGVAHCRRPREEPEVSYQSHYQNCVKYRAKAQEKPHA